MNFLQQLDEAANIPLDQLKDKMKKDPRVKMIFQRTLNVEELKDPVEFAKTIHYYIFNNPQVREYISKRGDRRDVSTHWFKRMAKSSNPTEKLSQMELEWLQSLVKELFKDVTYVQKKDISKRGFENLMSFYNNATSTIDAYTAREVESLGFKPAGPITLYRGMLFNEDSLRDKNGYGYGEGLKFLKSIRQGKRTVDLDDDQYVMWTTDKSRALLQALYGNEASWRSADDIKDGKIGKYRGSLAFVISTLAAPEDIIIDFSEYHAAHGWPPKNQVGYHSVIVKPGKRLARVVSRHTKEGEVDAIPQDETEDLGNIKQLLTMFGRILKLPFPEIKYENLSRFTHDPEVMEQISVLIDPEVKEKIRKLLNATMSFYQKHLKDLDLTKLADQAGQHSDAYAALRKIEDEFDGYIRHRDFANPNSVRAHERTVGTAKIKELTSGDQFLSAESYDGNAVEAANVIASQKRWTKWGLSGVWRGLAKIGNPNIHIPDKLHLEGWKVQKPVVDAAVDGFYKVLGKPKPDSFAEQAKEFVRVANEAAKVAAGAKFLQAVREAALSAGQ